MLVREALKALRDQGDPGALAGMARYGINARTALGVSVPKIRKVAKAAGTDHLLALGLWETGVHEARMLAAMVDDPRMVTERQMEAWVAEFDSWDVCDCCCGSLFDRTALGQTKAHEWSKRPEEFVRRAGYVLMAELAVHDKKAPDAVFEGFLSVVEERATDGRNFVKKAVNWALRQIGKRNLALNRKALAVARRLRDSADPNARWIGADAIRELESAHVQRKVRRSS